MTKPIQPIGKPIKPYREPSNWEVFVLLLFLLFSFGNAIGQALAVWFPAKMFFYNEPHFQAFLETYKLGMTTGWIAWTVWLTCFAFTVSAFFLAGYMYHRKLIDVNEQKENLQWFYRQCRRLLTYLESKPLIGWFLISIIYPIIRFFKKIRDCIYQKYNIFALVIIAHHPMLSYCFVS